MPTAHPAASANDLICIDLGTTNSRVWRVRADGSIVSRAHAQIGVRDSAREGNANLLKSTLRGLIEEICKPDPPDSSAPPACVIAAGMITSSLGLKEIPHMTAPAGISNIAAGTMAHSFPDVTSLPVYLVPGVRTVAGASIENADVMRGEETLCLGLISLKRICGEAIVLNLGSHWKAISINAAGQIAGSTTSLSGELIHVAQTSTILASAMPSQRPEFLDPKWVNAGMEQHRRSGLGRSLFCVRLLQLEDETTPQQRLAYLTGAFIAADLDALIKSGKIRSEIPILIAGHPGIATAWCDALLAESFHAEILNPSVIEMAMLSGLCEIFRLCRNRE